MFISIHEYTNPKAQIHRNQAQTTTISWGKRNKQVQHRNDREKNLKRKK